MYVLFFEECWLFQSCVGRWRVWKHEGGRKRLQDPFVGGECGVCAIPLNESDGYGGDGHRILCQICSSDVWVFGYCMFFLWYILGFFIWWIWSPSPLPYFSSISIMGILIFLHDNHILQESMLLFAAYFVSSFSMDVMFIAHVSN